MLIPNVISKMQIIPLFLLNLSIKNATLHIYSIAAIRSRVNSKIAILFIVTKFWNTKRHKCESELKFPKMDLSCWSLPHISISTWRHMTLVIKIKRYVVFFNSFAATFPRKLFSQCHIYFIITRDILPYVAHNFPKILIFLLWFSITFPKYPKSELSRLKIFWALQNNYKNGL